MDECLSLFLDFRSSVALWVHFHKGFLSKYFTQELVNIQVTPKTTPSISQLYFQCQMHNQAFLSPFLEVTADWMWNQASLGCLRETVRVSRAM